MQGGPGVSTVSHLWNSTGKRGFPWEKHISDKTHSQPMRLDKDTMSSELKIFCSLDPRDIEVRGDN